MEQGLIYAITNLINNKKYVGQTRKEINKRWSQHLSDRRYTPDRPLYKEMNEYGVDNFKIRILEECDVDKLNEREVWWIESLDSCNNGYNRTIGGSRQSECTEETKNKISEALKDLPRNPTWNNNVSESLKKKFERGEKWGFFATGNPNREHHKRKLKATNIETNEVFEFDSMREASIKIKGNNKYTGNISRAVKNNGSAYGYKWEKIDTRPNMYPVVGYDKKTGELVYEFESANKAQVTIRGKRGTGILKALKNPGKNSWMKCYWYYKNDINSTSS